MYEFKEVDYIPGKEDFITSQKMSFDELIQYYFPRKTRSQRTEILWNNTSFPYVGDRKKILDQIYCCYLKEIESFKNTQNGKVVSEMSF